MNYAKLFPFTLCGFYNEGRAEMAEFRLLAETEEVAVAEAISQISVLSKKGFYSFFLMASESREILGDFKHEANFRFGFKLARHRQTENNTTNL